MTRRLFDWYTLHKVGDPIHSGCIFFLGSWDQHHVPALEVSCVLEHAETYICLSTRYHQRKAALIVETQRERKKKSGIINLPSSKTKTKKRKQMTCTVR